MRHSLRNLYKKWLTFIVAVALGIGLSAIQLLPTWELQQASARRERTKEFIFSYSLPKSQYLTYFFPYLFGIAPPNSNIGYQQFGGLYWEFALYVGILPLSLALGGVSRKRPVPLVLSICFLIFSMLALGGYFRPYRVLVNILQLPFRVSARFLLPVTFCVAALAGWGLEEIIRIRKVRLHIFWIYGLLGLFLGVATLYKEMGRIPIVHQAGTFLDKVLTQFIFTEFQPIRFTHFSLRQPHIFLMSLLTVISCVSLILYVRKKISIQLLYGLVFALFLVDPYLQGFLYQMPVSQSILELPKVFTELRQGGRMFTYTEPAPVEVEKMTIQPNLNLIWDISSFNVVTPLPLELHEELNHLARNHPAFLSQLYVEYVISQLPLSFSQFQQIARTPYSYIYRNTQVLPRAFVATELQITASKAQTISILEQAVSKNKKVAVIETPPIDLPLVEKGARAKVTDIDARPTKVILRADTEQPGLLVFLDSYYPGWQAWVNGQKTPILRTNGFFRGVVVPAGTSEIIFQYVPQTLYYGISISLVIGSYWMYSYTSRRFFEL